MSVVYTSLSFDEIDSIMAKYITIQPHHNQIHFSPAVYNQIAFLSPGLYREAQGSLLEHMKLNLCEKDRYMYDLDSHSQFQQYIRSHPLSDNKKNDQLDLIPKTEPVSSSIFYVLYHFLSSSLFSSLLQDIYISHFKVC